MKNKILLLFLAAGVYLMKPEFGWTQTTQPVLLELFTSQGCSSCPPAEAILNTWAMDLFQAGKALPLAFHVDYWDSIGWKDPFSSSLATGRQRQYAAAFRDRSLYTPEMVVAGRVGFVGSDLRRAQDEIAASSPVLLPIQLAVHRAGKILSLKVKMNPPPKSPAPSFKLYAVVFENGLKTKVLQGENAGRELAENFVVRSWSEIQNSPAGPNQTVSASIPWVTQWNPAQTGAAVIAQDPRTMEIHGIQWVYPLAVK